MGILARGATVASTLAWSPSSASLQALGKKVNSHYYSSKIDLAENQNISQGTAPATSTILANLLCYLSSFNYLHCQSLIATTNLN